MNKAFGLVTAAVLLIGGATAAGAAEHAQRGGLPSLTLSPVEGPPGTTFAVSGLGCDEGRTVTVDTTASNQTSTTPSTDVEVVPALDGSWSVDLTVDHGSVPYQSVVIDAACSGGEFEDSAQTFRGVPPQAIGFEYQRAYFEVLPDPTMTLAPASGVAGSEFSVSGGTCSAFYEGMAQISDGTTDATVEPDVDGDWDTTFTVPDDAEVGDTITVMATCVTSEVPSFRSARRGESSNSFDYTPVVFTVTAEPTTPSTPAPTPTPTPSGGAVQADAATPTTATPTFTG